MERKSRIWHASGTQRRLVWLDPSKLARENGVGKVQMWTGAKLWLERPSLAKAKLVHPDQRGSVRRVAGGQPLRAVKVLTGGSNLRGLEAWLKW
jgi:hypothetical protein